MPVERAIDAVIGMAFHSIARSLYEVSRGFIGVVDRLSLAYADVQCLRVVNSRVVGGRDTGAELLVSQAAEGDPSYLTVLPSLFDEGGPLEWIGFDNHSVIFTFGLR